MGFAVSGRRSPGSQPRGGAVRPWSVCLHCPSGRRVDTLYQQIVDHAQAATGARLVHFAWLDPESRQVHVGAMSGLQTAAVQTALAASRHVIPGFDPLIHVRFPVDVNPSNWFVYSQGRPIATSFDQIVQGTVSPAIARIARAVAGLRYTFTCPLHQGSTVVGSLAFHFAKPLTDAQRRTCEAFAQQAALTLENARLYEQQREMLSRLQQLHGRLEAVELQRLMHDERRRIAEQLHDRVEQIFFSIALITQAGLDAMDSSDDPAQAVLARSRVLAGQGAEELRAAIFALNRAELYDEGLVPALWQIIREFRGRTGLEADLVLGGHEPRLPPEVTEALHAVAREALANTERHAKASAVVLSLSFDGAAAQLTVQDDGVGVSPLLLRTLADSSVHFGLRSVRQRVEQLGGRFTAQPGEDGGFVVRAWLPHHDNVTC